MGWEILPCKTAKISQETQPLLPDNTQTGSLFMWEMAFAAVFIGDHVMFDQKIPVLSYLGHDTLPTEDPGLAAGDGPNIEVAQCVGGTSGSVVGC